jgi:fumarate hydratase subunit alpha
VPRIIDTEKVVPVIRELIIDACINLNENTVQAIKRCLAREESPLGRQVLEELIENAAYAKKEHIACCHDTGVGVVYMEIGQEVSWTGKPLIEQVNEGVRQGYRDGYLRKSIVYDPVFSRVNTNDNCPAVVHTEIVPGDKVNIAVLPKGGGSENMSRYKMLTPADGLEGVLEFIMETVEQAGGKPCPPYIVGIGIGGTMDQCAWLSKKALFRPIGDRHKEKKYADLELELIDKINKTGIGPLGTGGRMTAMDVHIETQGCHITSLPVAVNIQCHAARRSQATI